MRPFSIFPLRKFASLVATRDTADVGAGGLLTATNAIPRPTGAIRGPMLYERLWAMGEDQASVTCTVAGDTFTRNSHNLVVGAVLRYTTTGVLPTGLAANTDYYIHSIPTANTFKVSATDGGAAMTVSGGSGTLSYTATITMKALYRNLSYARAIGYVDASADALYIEAHNLAVNDVVQFTTTGTLPAGISLATDYYIKTSSTGSVTISASLGGATLNITDAGTGTHTITLSALIGSSSTLRSRFKTIAVRTWRQGKHFVALYDLVNDKARGVFYMGDDGTHTGAYGFTSGTPSNEILAVGLDSDAMWFGSRVAGLLMIQNGVDDPVAVQLDRTKTPGKWRKCASNAFPATPTVALVAPANDANRQADLCLVADGYVSSNPATDQITLNGKAVVDGLPVQFTIAAGTLPVPLALATTYYTRDCVYTAATNSTTFKVAASLGGSAIDITVAETNASFALNNPAPRYGDLTFTLNADYQAGAAGNNLFKVAITVVSDVVPTYSTLTGTGTISDPYIYTVTCTSADSSCLSSVIATWVNLDSKVVSFLRAVSTGADGPFTTIEPLALQNGSGSGVSEGFTNKTVTVYLAYFDTGTNGFGYESPSSDLTAELFITETARNDVLVTITTNPSVEGGRFDKIRVYLQFGEGAEAIWNLMGSVDNTSGTKTLQIGSNTEIGLAIAEFDQNRPLPHKAIVAAASRTWRGGLQTAGFRERLYISKDATDDEKAPEGVGLEGYEIIDVPEATAPVAIRALFSDLFKLHVHTNQGIMIIDPANVANTPHRPAVNVGAMNPSCFGMGPNNAIIYIGQDAQPYNFNGNRYGTRNVKSAAKDAEAIIRGFANVDAIGQNADKVTSFQSKDGLLWWFFPNDAGTIIGVCLDIDEGGLWGYFDYPRAVSSCGLEPERPEILIQDETGQLFVYDTTAQNDSGADLPVVTTFAPIATTIPPTAGNSGYAYTDYLNQRYLKSVWTTIETGHIDLGKAGSLKSFMGIRFRPVANSRGILICTFTGITSGLSTSRTYGEMGLFTDIGAKQLMLALSDTSVKVKLEILSAEAKPFIIRDMELLYRG